VGKADDCKSSNASSCTDAGAGACAGVGGGLHRVLNGKDDVDDGRCRLLGSR
jgi:hypothetical protein